MDEQRERWGSHNAQRIRRACITAGQVAALALFLILALALASCGDGGGGGGQGAGNSRFAARTPLSELTIADSAFWNCIVETGAAYVEELTSLGCVGAGVASAAGIEQLTALVSLDLSANRLESIDLSENTALRGIVLDDNRLTALVLPADMDTTGEFVNDSSSADPGLTGLWARGNQLTSIEMTSWGADLLDLSGNGITAIDLSASGGFGQVILDRNALTFIDVSALGWMLRELSLNDNQLTAIDVSSNTELATLKMDRNRLASIDLSANSRLRWLSLRDNRLSAIEMMGNRALGWLDLSGNRLQLVDLSENSTLSHLDLSNNGLSTLALPPGSPMRTLILSQNRLASFDLADNSGLQALDLSSNRLATIDLPALSNLASLDLRGSPDIPCSDIEALAVNLLETEIRHSVADCGNHDQDADGLLADVDNCPFRYNPQQEDSDGDGVGDICDTDGCVPDNDFERALGIATAVTEDVRVSACAPWLEGGFDARFYRFEEQRAALQVFGLADGATARLALFDSCEVPGLITEWVGNRYADSVYPTPAEPIRTFDITSSYRELADDVVDQVTESSDGCSVDYDVHRLNFRIDANSEPGLFDLEAFADTYDRYLLTSGAVR